MGQESLNFEQPNNKPHHRLISIHDRISKQDIVQNSEILSREQKEKYHFLEDVPNWEDKLKKYNLINLIKERSKKKELFFYDSQRAAMEVRDLNDEYGKGTATYVDSVDPVGRKGFSLIIDRPLRPEFSDVLDSEDNLLPSKNSNRLAS